MSVYLFSRKLIMSQKKFQTIAQRIVLTHLSLKWLDAITDADIQLYIDGYCWSEKNMVWFWD